MKAFFIIYLQDFGHLSLVLSEDDVSRAVVRHVVTRLRIVGGVDATPNATRLQQQTTAINKKDTQHQDTSTVSFTNFSGVERYNFNEMISHMNAF